ncbi:hypothetical protein CSOJ01_15582, partial [Colletotrichum sojae]
GANGPKALAWVFVRHHLSHRHRLAHLPPSIPPIQRRHHPAQSHQYQLAQSVSVFGIILHRVINISSPSAPASSGVTTISSKVFDTIATEVPKVVSDTALSTIKYAWRIGSSGCGSGGSGGSGGRDWFKCWLRSGAVTEAGITSLFGSPPEKRVGEGGICSQR